MIVTDEVPTKTTKTLHKTIKKVADVENFSFNTSVSQFMICVNELTAQGCHSRAVLTPGCRYFPMHHISEELWSLLGRRLYCNGAFSCFRTNI
jgi:leucyl-tRNA synthetase